MSISERIEYLAQCAREDFFKSTDPLLTEYYEGQLIAYQTALNIIQEELQNEKTISK